jgi:hypothetical protein
MSRIVKSSKSHLNKSATSFLPAERARIARRRELTVEAESVQAYEPKMHLIVFGKDMSLDEIEAHIRAMMGWDEKHKG